MALYVNERGGWKAVPRQKISVGAEITDYVACVTSQLEFLVNTKKALPARFLFPVGDDSVIYQLHVITDDSVIGVLKVEDESITENLIKKTQSDALLDLEIGTVLPGITLCIKFKYLVKLPMNIDGAAIFTLPQALNPLRRKEFNAVSSQVSIPHNIEHIKHMSSTFTDSLDYEFTANIRDSKTVKDVTSQVLVNRYKPTGNVLQLRVADDYKFDRRIQFEVAYKNPHIPRILVSRGSNNETGIFQSPVAMVTFYPQIIWDQMAGNIEFTFIVDLSDLALEDVKGALLLSLTSLPIGCYFRVIIIGQQHNEVVCFPESRCCDDESLRQALTLLDCLTADSESAELSCEGSDHSKSQLRQALQCVYDNRELPGGFSRQVFLFTGNTVPYSEQEECLRLIKENAHNTKLSSFGIGRSTPMKKQLRKFAKFGGGTSQSVENIEELENKVMSTLRTAMRPSLVNLVVKWDTPDGVTVENVPNSLPVVFSAEHLVVYALMRGNIQDNAQISAKLSGKLGATDFEERVSCEFTEAQADEEFALHRFAAVKKLKMLEDSLEAELSKSGDDAVVTNIKQQISQLNKECNIASSLTVFRSEENNNTDLCKAMVPSPGTGLTHLGSHPALAQKYASEFEAVLQLQNCNGSWHCSDQLYNILASTPNYSSQCNKKDEVSTTELVIDWLKQRYSHRLDHWAIIAEKTTKWLHYRKVMSLQNEDGFWKPCDVVKEIVGNQFGVLNMPDTVRTTELVLRWLRDGYPEEEGWSDSLEKAKQWQEVQTVLRLQTRQGYWTFNTELVRYMDCELTKTMDEDMDKSIRGTKLVIKWLTISHYNRSRHWSNSVEKANQWLHNQLKTVLSLQQQDGSWEAPTELKQPIGNHIAAQNVKNAMAATQLAVTWLEQNFQEEMKKTMKLDQARKWLKVEEVICLQNEDGSWHLAEKLVANLADHRHQEPQDDSVTTTELVVDCLNQVYPDRSSQWGKPVQRAKGWLQLQAVLDLQHEDGFWEVNKKLLQIIKEAPMSENNNKAVTKSVIKWMEEQQMDRKPQWILAANQAERWLVTQTQPGTLVRLYQVAAAGFMVFVFAYIFKE